MIKFCRRKNNLKYNFNIFLIQRKHLVNNMVINSFFSIMLNIKVRVKNSKNIMFLYNFNSTV